MKSKFLILLFVSLLFGVGTANAQNEETSSEKKDKNAKISEVVLSAEMHCQSCADKIKKQLAYTKGVIDVQANFEKDVVYIKFRNDRTNTDKLIASLKEIGFDANVYAKTGCGACPHSKAGACSGNHQSNSGCQGNHQEEKKSGCNGNHSNCHGNHQNEQNKK